jgi:hypothetical protein
MILLPAYGTTVAACVPRGGAVRTCSLAGYLRESLDIDPQGEEVFKRIKDAGCLYAMFGRTHASK